MAVISGRWFPGLDRLDCVPCHIPFDLAEEKILRHKGAIAFHWKWRCANCGATEKTVHQGSNMIFNLGTWLRKTFGRLQRNLPS